MKFSKRVTNTLSAVAGLAGKKIPGKFITNWVHFLIMKAKVRSQAKAEGVNVKIMLDRTFKRRIKKLNQMSAKQRLDLGTDLAVAFICDKYFRKGSILDYYRQVYSKCDTAQRTTLDTLSGNL
ncbi:hypothetical protein [Priestia megaterium]|uniref:hypothetical protein n=1 Tax=Priestia megaterium TaxID=1404 RepID=UPI0021D67781|nr:hypothetical protein [Priestia megaterium]MCU7766485.1 hypothetical protein [Priestia megaterium]